MDDDSENVFFPLPWARGLMTSQHYDMHGAPGTQPTPTLISQNDFDARGYSTFIVRAADASHVDAVAKEIRSLGLGAATARSYIAKQLQMFDILSLLLAGIGVIALSVAALGVINTMVMAILERTRQIGIMRACGATQATVRRLFVFEAACLGFLGGVLGVAAGFGLTRIANVVVNQQLAHNSLRARDIIGLPGWLVLVVVAATTGIGLVAGLYPAHRAARLDPVQAPALRIGPTQKKVPGMDGPARDTREFLKQRGTAAEWTSSDRHVGARKARMSAAPVVESPPIPMPRGDDTRRRAPDAQRAPGRVSTYLLGYLMGPAALVAILFLGRYHVVASESVWLWIGVFIAIPSASAVADIAYRRHPSDFRLQARVAVHAAAVTVVIYLSGWGPVLTGAFVFVALENIAHDGSRTWRMTMAWSLAGIAFGQLAILWGWMPSFLSTTHAEAVGLMGVFVLLFVIRMAGAAAEQKEDAEGSMRASEDRFRSLVQHSSDTTLVIADNLVITYASPATLTLLGREPESVVGLDATSLVHPDDRERVGLQFAARLQEKSVADPVEFRMAHADGTWRDAEAVLSDLRDTPSVAGYVANLRDTTERKVAEALLAHQAVHDPLTGLANRTLILDRAEQMLVRCARGHQPVAALFIDLDNFKDVNDTLGHEAGDKLLQAVADRFTATVRASDTVGRLGGDEFVVLAEGVSLAAGPELLAERIQEVLREPFRLDGVSGPELFITASIGIAGGTRATADDMLRDADIALYRAKANGKDRWTLFAPEMQSEVLDRLGLKMDLQSALERDEFFLLYQPLFDLDTTSVYGVEALIRWQHPDRGVVGPDDFIPMLEEGGLIVDVGRWVLDEACRQAAAWTRDGHELTMSVNVSMRQLETPALIDHVSNALAVSGLAPSGLLLEITETALMRGADATIARLTQLKSLGVRLAIDDFGTGYSSLGYLRQFPIDALKIDRSFITAMNDSPESNVLIHTMVALGRALGLGTLAEGIEDRGQLEQLRLEGCEHGQGFLVSEPIEAGQIVAMLAGQAGRI